MTLSPAALIAERLPAGLVHPGDPDNDQPAKLIPLPGLNNIGIPADQAAFFAQEAGLPDNDVPKLIGEAIVAMLSTEGWEIVAGGELEQLRADAAQLPERPDAELTVHCRCNPAEPLLALSTAKAIAYVSGAALRERLATVCRCG